ncbi:MAG: hypothetical protein ACD_21C00202G0003 [uncultured bacterium]|nr:MAG: hypothetical protein ACD_21C00202G0003 [uncultured bacterium]
MVKKNSYYLIFISLMMFCIAPPVFAGFEVEVVNKSDVEYDVDLVIAAVGFDAMYGRISLGTIAPGRNQTFTCPYTAPHYPLTFTNMSSLDECNLDMTVFATPRQEFRRLVVGNFKNIIPSDKGREAVYEEGKKVFPPRPSPELSMRGIKPPQTIKIIIKGSSDDIHDGVIEAKFNRQPYASK